MANLEIYNKYRCVPKEAQKTIQGGKLNGFIDINPMWRIKCLTDQFGPIGLGWYIEINHIYKDDVSIDGKICSTINIQVSLYVKYDGKEGWSAPIIGVGGSRLSALTKNGLELDDEAYKKAYTDAVSVCCKQLGIGADIYWQSDPSKYSADDKDTAQANDNKKVVKYNLLPGSKWWDHACQKLSNGEVTIEGLRNAGMIINEDSERQLRSYIKQQ